MVGIQAEHHLSLHQTHHHHHEDLLCSHPCPQISACHPQSVADPCDCALVI